MNPTKNRGCTQVLRKGRSIGNEFFKYHNDRTVPDCNSKDWRIIFGGLYGGASAANYDTIR